MRGAGEPVYDASIARRAHAARKGKNPSHKAGAQSPKKGLLGIQEVSEEGD